MSGARPAVYDPPMSDALFVIDGDTAVPSELTRGPWDPNAMHGGPPSALLARAVERCDEGPTPFVARLTVELHDLVWDTLYAPIAAAVVFTADRLNRLQFLTIRQFLSLVFAFLVILLLVLAIWP